ncbi:MAG TPA: TetR/AcrR family transcriptional regulator C-terminal domain-containing protein [Microbacterium sp.]|nr:TetR/AcrR family transcriptional regulator C-terminal domain-containing protein [Microbacterium sp.]
MVKEAVRKRRQRGSIDPEEIMDGAFAVAERIGLDNLSMPELASHLDVGVTSIYWYYRNKEDLLRRMSSRAVQQVIASNVLPDGYPPSEWKSFLRDYHRVNRQFLAEHDLITDLTLMRTAAYSRRSTLAIYQGIENSVRYLTTAGFSLTTAWHVYSTLSLYTRGLTIAERNRRENNTPPPGDRQLGLLDPVSMPLISSLVREEQISIDMADDRSFEYGLEMLLTEAERLLERDREATEAE